MIILGFFVMSGACGGEATKVPDGGAAIDAPVGPDAPPGAVDAAAADRAPDPVPDASPPDAVPGEIDATPPDIDAGPPGTGVIGAPCDSAAECIGDTFFTAGTGWPLGYCSEAGCSTADPIGSCAAFGGDGVCASFGGGPSCFDRCPGGSADCRPGYTCLAFSPGAIFCVPE